MRLVFVLFFFGFSISICVGNEKEASINTIKAHQKQILNIHQSIEIQSGIQRAIVSLVSIENPKENIPGNRAVYNLSISYNLIDSKKQNQKKTFQFDPFNSGKTYEFDHIKFQVYNNPKLNTSLFILEL